MIITGCVDGAWRSYIAGWVRMSNAGSKPPLVEIWSGGRAIYCGVADYRREDLVNRPEYHGFRVKVEESLSCADLTSGNLKVLAKDEDSEFELKLTPEVISAGRLDEAVCEVLPSALRFVERDRLDQLEQALRARHLPTIRPAKPPQRISDDEAAVAGANGYLFLYRGSNRVQDLYTETEVSSSIIERWTAVLTARAVRASAAGAKYLQILIPEKSSVMPHLRGGSITGPSILWREIMRSMSAVSYARDFELIDGYKILSTSACSDATFRMLDSHLSTYGSELLTTAILNGMSQQAMYKHGEFYFEQRTGDLGSKFSAKNEILRSETIKLLRSLHASNDAPLVPKLISSNDPPVGHKGILRAWTTENAPIQKTVVCFGNSFFERGGGSPTLSWWFARLFREFHFIWSPDIDWEYVHDAKPDFIIGQTIERFLKGVPTT